MKTGQIFFIDFTDSSPAAAAAETPLAERKLCAIESAARLHPKNIIYLVTNSAKIKLSKALRILIRTYSNVRFIIFDSDPFSAFGIDPESDSKNLHAAELARYSLLLSHGGIYLDLDQIVVKPIIGKFIRNTLGRQFDDEGNILLSGHVMAFPPGHDFLEQVMLQIFVVHYWGSVTNGTMIELASTQLLALLAWSHCPMVSKKSKGFM
ncbi:unnamed protein product [Notodromas monacha]|uniref:Alpha-1,4-N-acetylglucosaminyltransferase n=1 Tax=Notodromas monacha TaxID=399045 RepID=A0A7R9BRP2_9CRUS|nr:unnamed protein product [Notodromas monacha]CAG0919085.1 unnamed protein product [Notodromas monacha]